MDGEMLGVMGVVFMAVIMPMIVTFHYITKWKETKTLSKEDEQMLEDLWEDAQRMESRINSLETILDKSSAEWRKHT